METFSAVREDRSKKMRCDIVTDAKDDQAPEGLAELQVDLRQMVNNSAFSDVVFVCNDGKRVHASRILLAGRSEVLKKMLFNGMAETRLFEIELREISSPALLSVLEFLYTGALMDYHPQSWTAACELILASRFFLLPKLELIIRQFMHKQIFDVAGDLPKAASLLTEAVGSNGLCDKEDVFRAELVTSLSSSLRLDFKSVQPLSEDAIQYLLMNSKSTAHLQSCPDSVSIREYFRFIYVFQWFIDKVNLGSCAINALRKFFSERESKAVSLCKDPKTVERGESPLLDAASLLNGWNFGELDDTTKNSVTRLLSNIDYRRIHPVLLAGVVEPLGMTPPSKILDAFRFHALRNPVVLSTHIEYVWDHGESCQTLEDGRVIERAASKIGLAVMKGAMPHSDRVYEWTFTVEEICDNFIELGFIYSSSILGAARPKSDCERLSDQDRAGALKLEGCQWSVNSDGSAGRADWKQLPDWNPLPWSKKTFTVLFTYRDSEHTCSLSINHRDFGVVWKTLPNRLFYPAVCFGESSKGRVRIK